jgi:DNA-binding response OmpR family regulator
MDVLLVEQDDVLRSDIAETLTRAGLDVAELAVGEDALAMPRAAGAPRILVTDLDLPGMDGIHLAREAQRRWPALGIIYLSGRKRRDGVGLQGPVLPKPVDGAAVLRAIETLKESFRAH